MARHRKRRASAIEALLGVAALVGLSLSTHRALFEKIPQKELAVGLIAVLAIGFVAAVVIYRRSGICLPKLAAAPTTADAASLSSEKSSQVQRSRRTRLDELMEVTEVQSPTDWSLRLLQKLECKRFGELCADYFEAAGGFTTRATRRGAAGDSDFYLYSPIAPNGRVVGVVQCGAGDDTNQVGLKQVRKLYGLMAAKQARIAMFITAGTYTDEARAFAIGKPLQLLSAEDLLEKLRSLPTAVSRQLLERVTAGDYTAPSCPQCGITMKPGTSRIADATEERFWSCVDPACQRPLMRSKEQNDFSSKAA